MKPTLQELNDSNIIAHFIKYTAILHWLLNTIGHVLEMILGVFASDTARGCMALIKFVVIGKMHEISCKLKSK